MVWDFQPEPKKMRGPHTRGEYLALMGNYSFNNYFYDTRLRELFNPHVISTNDLIDIEFDEIDDV